MSENPTSSESLTGGSQSATPQIDIRAATLADVEGIYALIEEASHNTTVLPRTRAAICENVRDFRIAASGSEVVGCGALHIWAVDLGEIKSLVTAERLRGHKIGRRLVEVLNEEARRLGLRRVFVLTDSVDFFVRSGFAEADKATLPHKVWNECILCPKFDDCDEVALELWLDREGRAAP